MNGIQGTRTICMLTAGFFLSLAAAQTHKITVHANQRVVSLEMSPAEYAGWKTNDEYNVGSKRQALIKDIYLTFNDAFDFIFLVLNEKSSPSNLDYAGEEIAVSNQVTGLGSGIRTFDETKAYGSAGKLKSLMALTEKGYVMGGPSLHELMHAWGNFGISAGAYNPFGPNSGGAIADFQPHWGFVGGNTAGQLGGFVQSTLKTNVGGKAKRYSTAEFGQFANGGNCPVPRCSSVEKGGNPTLESQRQPWAGAGMWDLSGSIRWEC